MKYLESKPGRFRRIPDPYGHDRPCFECLGGLDRTDLYNLLQDPKFFLIGNDLVIYFDK